MAGKTPEQIITEQAREIEKLKQAVSWLEKSLRVMERKAARANDGVRMLRNDVQTLHRMMK